MLKPEATPEALEAVYCDLLASRLGVGRILRSGRVPAIELRAAMIVGPGSDSWQIVRDLALKLLTLSVLSFGLQGVGFRLVDREFQIFPPRVSHFLLHPSRNDESRVLPGLGLLIADLQGGAPLLDAEELIHLFIVKVVALVMPPFPAAAGAKS